MCVCSKLQWRTQGQANLLIIYMSSNKQDMTDFDVSNYPIEDLFAIMGILDQQPFTKAEIIDHTQKFIDKYEKIALKFPNSPHIILDLSKLVGMHFLMLREFY